MEATCIVSGYMRTGTSMMMQIMQAGGLDVCYDKNVDIERNKNLDVGEIDYHPNPNGYFELDNINLDTIQGKAVKIMRKEILKKLSNGNYKIIFMLRNETERVHSVSKSFIKTHIPKERSNAGTRSYFQKEFSFLFNKNNIEILFVEYSLIIIDPKKEIKRIFKFLDCELNLREAIKVVDPSLYRFRKENL